MISTLPKLTKEEYFTTLFYTIVDTYYRKPFFFEENSPLPTIIKTLADLRKSVQIKTHIDNRLIKYQQLKKNWL